MTYRSPLLLATLLLASVSLYSTAAEAVLVGVTGTASGNTTTGAVTGNTSTGVTGAVNPSTNNPNANVNANNNTAIMPNNRAVMPNNTAVSGQMGNINSINPQSPNNTTTATNVPVWNSQNQYWQQHYSKTPYFSSNISYSTVAPAYQYGVALFVQNNKQPWNTLNQSTLSAGWDQAHANSN